jgi:hypothetical protein
MTCALPITPGEILLTADDLPDLAIDCTTGFVATDLQVGFPSVRPVVRSRALGDGAIDNSAFLGARAITLSLTLDTTVGTPQSLIDRIMPFMAQTRRPRLSWRLGDTVNTGVGVDNRWRSAVVRGVDAPLVITGPRYWTVVLSFVTIGAYLESKDVHTTTVTTAVGGPSPLVPITNSGTAPSPWVMTLVAPGASVINNYDFSLPTATLNVQAYNLLSGYTMEIDSLNRTALAKVGGVVVDNIYPFIDSTYWEWSDLWFPPGTDNLQLSLSSPGYSVTATFTWRDSWL